MFTNLKKNGSLFDEYEHIQGKNPKEALKNHYNLDFKRAYGDEGRYADVILLKGHIKDRTIYPDGRYTQMCFRKLNN